MTIAAAAPASPSHRGLRLVLAAVAALELLDGIPYLANIFTDYGHTTAYLKFAQALMSVKIALTPVFAGAAFVFAAIGKVRTAITALAGLILLGFVLDDLTSIPLHGLELSADFGGFTVFVGRVVAPAAAIIAGTLAWHDRRLALAGLLVSIPIVFHWLGVLAFAIGVMMYGF